MFPIHVVFSFFFTWARFYFSFMTCLRHSLSFFYFFSRVVLPQLVMPFLSEKCTASLEPLSFSHQNATKRVILMDNVRTSRLAFDELAAIKDCKVRVVLAASEFKQVDS